MTYEQNKKWAIISQITGWGWIIAVVFTLKKERSSLLRCYLNNGFVVFLYGMLVNEINPFLDDPIRYVSPKYFFLFTPFTCDILTIFSILITGLYLLLQVAGLIFAIRGEERYIPYIFKIDFFEKYHLF